jgi:AcrR family transcriptional regulator
MDSSNKPARSAADWLEAGLASLARQGAEAVKVEPLARELGVTKGSFYWHFRDRNALLEGILERWQEVTTQAIIARIDALGGTPAARLQALVDTTSQTKRGARLDQAIRAWAARDRRARAALQAVDAQREAYVRDLLIEHGLSPARAGQRARILYLALIGEFTWIAQGAPASGAAPWNELVKLLLS